jgi:hypothetical protein
MRQNLKWDICPKHERSNYFNNFPTFGALSLTSAHVKANYPALRYKENNRKELKFKSSVHEAAIVRCKHNITERFIREIKTCIITNFKLTRYYNMQRLMLASETIQHWTGTKIFIESLAIFGLFSMYVKLYGKVFLSIILVCSCTSISIKPVISIVYSLYQAYIL